MFTAVGKYALINAKLRARISTMLSENFFSSLAKCRSLHEMLQTLRGSTFSDLADIYDRTGDLKMVELALYRKEAAVFGEMEPFLPPEAVPLTKAYEAGYEMENLKNALRLFFDHVIRKRDVGESLPYLMREQLVHAIPFDRIINAAGIDEIARLLDHTPYGEIVRAMIPEVERMRSLFPLTSALDRHYYRRLLEETANLTGRDRIVASRLIGIEIDLQNISWIIRFRSFYQLPYETVSGLIIPGGFTVKGTTLQDVYRSQQLSPSLETMLRKNYPGVTALLSRQNQEQSSKLSIIERLLEEIMAEEVRRIMQGYPFTVGIVLAYFILKRLEIKRIRTVLNAGQYRLSRERTEGAL